MTRSEREAPCCWLCHRTDQVECLSLPPGAEETMGTHFKLGRD
jgi:hypothetical protein